MLCCFFFLAEDGIRDLTVTGVPTCALPIWVRNRKGNPVLNLALLYLSRAHFNAQPKIHTYVELPPERYVEGMCGKLIYNLYGTRGAAQAWER